MSNKPGWLTTAPSLYAEVRPDCVVTGGKETIPITCKGQTSFVCCSACKQAFNENPEKILAEYRERIAKRGNDAK